jgi:hypothetical protein
VLVKIKRIEPCTLGLKIIYKTNVCLYGKYENYFVAPKNTVWKVGEQVNV